jgi:hypothetical protein
MRRRDFVAFVGALVACPFSARARQQERSLNVSGFEEAKRQFDKISQIWRSAKKTGGRKEGTPNKRTAKMRDATRRVLEDAQLRGRMDDLDAHGFMVLWYRNRDLPVELRIQAATAAARFERPALQTRLPRLVSGLRSHIRMERD